LDCAEPSATTLAVMHDDELIPTRVTLLNRLKDKGSDAGWQEFFDTYWKLIYGVARRSGLSDAEAQDVVQETMIAVARHMPGFNYDPANGSFKAWLLNMTRWRITDQVRRRSKRAISTADSEEIPTTTQVEIEEIIDPASNEPA
jgi:RNA polymerase sigma-70 factor (ECF subfamily)